MESEKVKEIKKALEHCGEKITCQGCPEYNNEPVIDWFECKKNLLQKALTLINELESENERLTSRYRNLEINYNDTWEHYREYEVENQQLKDRIVELEKENGELKQHITEVEKGIINIARERNKKEELASKFIDSYNDSLKQFAERLKRKAIRRQEFIGELAIDDIEYVKTRDIDETLKEFIK